MQPDQDNSTLGTVRKRRVWVTVFCLAVAVRLLNIVFLPTDAESLLQEDANLYWSGAAVLLEHGSFSRTFEDGLLPQTERVPGYFLFLAGIRALFSDSLVAALIAQAFIDAVTCVLIAALAGLLAHRLVLPSGTLAALWPNLVIHSGVMLTETLFLTLFVAMLTAGGLFLRDGLPKWAALAGLALGLAILTRPIAQVLPFLMLPAAFAVPLWHKRGVGAALLAATLFIICASAPLAPLLHRNHEQFGAFALNSQTGYHIIGWVAPLVRHAADGTPREVGATELTAEALSRTAIEGQKPEDINYFRQSSAFTRIGLEAIRRYPILAIAKAWANGAAINLTAPAVAIDARVRALPHPSFDATPGCGFIHDVIVNQRGGMDHLGDLCQAAMPAWSSLTSVRSATIRAPSFAPRKSRTAS